MQTALAILSVLIPWLVLAVAVARRLAAGLRPQRWQYETAVIGALGAAAAWRIDPTWSGWASYGAALLAHGAASIRSRVGTAYSALRSYVRRHAPDTEALHAVECLSKLGWYAWGATLMALAIAFAKGVAPAAIVQWATSETYSWYRRWHIARRGRVDMTWRRAVTGLVRGEVDAAEAAS